MSNKCRLCNFPARDDHVLCSDCAENERACPSCGILYIEHLGLIGTCEAVQELKSELEALHAAYDKLNAAYAVKCR